MKLKDFLGGCIYSQKLTVKIQGEVIYNQLPVNEVLEDPFLYKYLKLNIQSFKADDKNSLLVKITK